MIVDMVFMHFVSLIYNQTKRLDTNNSTGHARPRPTLRSGFPLIVFRVYSPTRRATSSRGLLFIFSERLCRRDACVGRATGSLRHGSSSHRFVDLVVEEDDIRSHVNRSSKWRAVPQLNQRWKTR